MITTLFNRNTIHALYVIFKLFILVSVSSCYLSSFPWRWDRGGPYIDTKYRHGTQPYRWIMPCMFHQYTNHNHFEFSNFCARYSRFLIIDIPTQSTSYNFSIDVGFLFTLKIPTVLKDYKNLDYFVNMPLNIWNWKEA